MGNLYRTALWTAAVIIICFLLAWSINRYRVNDNNRGEESVQAPVQTPANPGGDWPQFHGNRAQNGFVTGELYAGKQ